jgi:hypothetical protein
MADERASCLDQQKADLKFVEGGAVAPASSQHHEE